MLSQKKFPLDILPLSDGDWWLALRGLESGMKSRRVFNMVYQVTVRDRMMISHTLDFGGGPFVTGV